MSSNILSLDVFLHDKLIGTIVHLPGDRNLFSFDEGYIENEHRDTLSLSFNDTYKNLITDIKSTRSSLPPFFSNLLPEGHMREYLASLSNVNPVREFFLLQALGEDLPGAIKVIPSNFNNKKLVIKEHKEAPLHEEKILHFSLAGIQLKFSAIHERDGGLTIPAHGVGGSWIVKLPSFTYSKVTENEFTMMSIAKKIGIDVPEIQLVSIDKIKGLPQNMAQMKNYAYIIKRFDRDPCGRAIHIEDFAQVFNIFPDKKYRIGSYRNIAQVLKLESGNKCIEEFIRRFVFNALIGNGDMHLKNWSLIYLDKKKPTLAPAYDFVSTIPYIPDDRLALNFVDSKTFTSLTKNQFLRFSSKLNLNEPSVLATVEKTVRDFKYIWKSVSDFPIDLDLIESINKHLETVPIWKEFN